MNIKRIHIILFISSFFVFSSCLKEDDLKNPFTGFEPMEINDGTIISGPSAENVDSLLLRNIFNDIAEDENLWTLKSLLKTLQIQI